MTPQARIEAVLNPLGIEIGFSATHLPTGATVGINPGLLCPTASVYKIPVMVEVYRQADEGRFKMTDRIALNDRQRIIGSGVLQKLDAGLAPTIRDLVMLMIIISDNMATHVLTELVGAVNVTATMRRLGLADIHVVLSMPQLFAHGFGLPPEPAPDYAAMQAATKRQAADYDSLLFARTPTNTTSSAADMAALSAMVYRNEAGTAASCADMMTILRAQQSRERVPRFLPNGAVANKTGTFGGVRNDAGVILRSETDAISFGLFTFDRTPLPIGNSRILAERNVAVTWAMGEVGQILWDHLGT